MLMPPRGRPAQGSYRNQAILVKGIAGAQAAGVAFVLGSVNDVGLSGDLAWHSGTFSVTNKAGATIDTGKYLEAWRRTGGTWHIVRDIWNSDAAAPAPPPPAAPK